MNNIDIRRKLIGGLMWFWGYIFFLIYRYMANTPWNFAYHTQLGIQDLSFLFLTISLMIFLLPPTKLSITAGMIMIVIIGFDATRHFLRAANVVKPLSTVIKLAPPSGPHNSYLNYLMVPLILLTLVIFFDYVRYHLLGQDGRASDDS